MNDNEIHALINADVEKEVIYYIINADGQCRKRGDVLHFDN